ncbi:MAG TPA: NADP-dependent malic enzyme [Candidatus Saccharicenans sp.]|nr:NADP-dependent malic enzyme [Candidatus Saccharicenans sp.]HOL44896.1 NADP-dependent malic enzyme [Candidatus Saccharicenans sp.]HOM93872.1 NADP-dependent malic enzyme [Candidatus Saccharicenans sp.]HOT68801.1 NADP-dependent malic enzyme [Candidatus Saccharicenans sp.]HPC87387.1 NADP-dependent malic enzyme [Candidatus Saccharicenans sp.]
MDKKVTVEELLAKAQQPSKDALRLHPFYRGKVGVTLKCRVRTFQDFAIWYTPGVAAPCMEINKDPEKAYEMTNKGNFVAVVSDGTRVLGLGDIGPEAAMPVMEGKALLYKYLGGVDAFPICLREKDPDKIIYIVKALQPTFGGVNLEDISHPKCFHILDTLRAECEIPIWHDDQQGTACVTVAGLINALKIVNKKIEEVKVTVVGSGAAGIAIARLLMAAGVNPENMLAVDSKGILSKDRADRETLQTKYKEKWDLCLKTNPKNKQGDLAESIKGADVLISVSASGPGVIKPEWIKTMARDAIVFAEANPIPEIWPWEAKEAGARIVATGRSDFPNQVNNSLGFPGIFRGTLDVRAKTITDEMCIAAANELAKVAEDNGINEEYIIPNMDQWEVFPREAVAVGRKAIEQGVARKDIPADELYKMAENTIRKAREEVQLLMKEGFIADPDKA